MVSAMCEPRRPAGRSARGYRNGCRSESARGLKRHGPLIFGSHKTTDINVITDIWRRKLNRLWDLCAPWKEKPTPHRFRHTFARILLQKPGVTVRDVAELLGDTEEIVLKHYGAWVPVRQARLTKILRDAFEEKPKLVVMPMRETAGND